MILPQVTPNITFQCGDGFMKFYSNRAEGVTCSEAGVPSRCELPDVSAGNQTWVLCRSSKSSWPLSRLLCSPTTAVLLN